jgi:hypothetical protein
VVSLERASGGGREGREYVLFLENKGSCQCSALWDGPSRGTDAVSWKPFPIQVIRDGR